MTDRILARCLKVIIILFALSGLIVYGHVIPFFADNLRYWNPEYAYAYWPWMILVMATAVPCYISLVFIWKLVSNFKKKQSFYSENAKLLKWIAKLAIGDSVFFLLGNLLMAILGIHHGPFFLLAMFLILVGTTIAVCTTILSGLFSRAASLQEKDDLTI